MCNNAPVHNISESFAGFFDKKVTNIVNQTLVNQDVYNGRRKIHANAEMFMAKNNIIECINSLKIKNTEGFDRIPQRILIDGRDAVIEPLASLFKLIYRDTMLPEQWLISKIIPVHKKGDKSSIENCRSPLLNNSTVFYFNMLYYELVNAPYLMIQ